MNERLSERVRRLVSGSFNAIVDLAENAAPEAVMEQSIREVESAVADARGQLGEAEARQYRATVQRDKELKRHEELAEQIDLAVKEGREDLARAGIERQMNIDAQLPVLDEARASAAADIEELSHYVQALQGKRLEMLDELEAFRRSQRDGAGAQAGASAKVEMERRVEKSTNSFDRTLTRVSGLGVSARASGRESDAQLAELERLSRRNRVDEKLAAIKAKLADKE